MSYLSMDNLGQGAWGGRGRRTRRRMSDTEIARARTQRQNQRRAARDAEIGRRVTRHKEELEGKHGRPAQRRAKERQEKYDRKKERRERTRSRKEKEREAREKRQRENLERARKAREKSDDRRKGRNCRARNCKWSAGWRDEATGVWIQGSCDCTKVTPEQAAPEQVQAAQPQPRTVARAWSPTTMRFPAPRAPAPGARPAALTLVPIPGYAASFAGLGESYDRMIGAQSKIPYNPYFVDRVWGFPGPEPFTLDGLGAAEGPMGPCWGKSPMVETFVAGPETFALDQSGMSGELGGGFGGLG